MQTDNPRERALAFLKVAHLYRLGVLPTEQPHPRTERLSDWAGNNTSRAVSVLKDIDLVALRTLQCYSAQIDRLAESVRATLDRGKRVYLGGCGATGRLALSLEYLWRQKQGNDDRVRAFMAGGDVALVHALEGFEDHPAYGARHLEELGFSKGDLLISCTEGGETPYVIGATEKAAQMSSNAPYFLHCNTNEGLARHVERSRRVLENPRINTVSLHVGPMALAGSTRMQASTVLQLAVGVALLYPDMQAKSLIHDFTNQIAETDYLFLTRFIERESDIYSAGDYITYRVREYGITVLTDTTERAPTFSLIPFGRFEDKMTSHSLCYVALDAAEDSDAAWTGLLNREPRPLGWAEIDPRTTQEYLSSFDFSSKAVRSRQQQIRGRTHHEFRIDGSGTGLEFQLGSLEHSLNVSGIPYLFRHLMLKQLLNIHSTVVMGRLGRYQNNVMTWVTPTNGKLVDRAVRYVQLLLGNAGKNHSYEDITFRLFHEMDRIPANESVVVQTYRSLLRQREAS